MSSFMSVSYTHLDVYKRQVQDVYADTAACLLIRKEIHDEVSGLDESYAVAFNDVDFCCLLYTSRCV